MKNIGKWLSSEVQEKVELSLLSLQKMEKFDLNSSGIINIKRCINLSMDPSETYQYNVTIFEPETLEDLSCS